MNSTERRALAKIIDQRFKALQAELDTRREQVEEEIRDRLIAESTRACAAAEKRMLKLVNRAKALQADVLAEVEAIAETGVIPGEIHTFHRYNPKKSAFVGPQVIETHAVDPLTFDVTNAWAPVNLEEQIAAEIRRLVVERGQGGRSLDAIRLDLQEKLLLGDVQSDEARAFLDEIPTVDVLLPMPTEKPELTP
jgi:hypothetical protein